MIKFFKKLFGRKPVDTGKWRCIFIDGKTKIKIDLGEFVGSKPEAMEECYGRQMVWYFKSGSREPVYGDYGVESIE